MRWPENPKRYTYSEFLQQEANDSDKHEFFRGEIFSMGGGSINHALLGANLVRVIGNGLGDRSCTVFGSDLLVRMEEVDAAFYPDVMVVCGEEIFADERKNAIINPQLVIEVLSPTTAAWDRGGKFRVYELLGTLNEYVLVEQNEAQIDVFRRREAGFWQLERYQGMDSEVILESLGIRITMKEIYRGVDLG